MPDTVSDNVQAKKDQIFDQILPQFRGLYFERLFAANNPQEPTRRLELASALLWVEKNTHQHLLFSSLLTADSSNEKRGAIPQTEREWEIAELVAATLMQWIVTQNGTAFLQEAFRRAGGSLTYKLPPEILE